MPFDALPKKSSVSFQDKFVLISGKLPQDIDPQIIQTSPFKRDLNIGLSSIVPSQRLRTSIFGSLRIDQNKEGVLLPIELFELINPLSEQSFRALLLDLVRCHELQKNGLKGVDFLKSINNLRNINYAKLAQLMILFQGGSRITDKVEVLNTIDVITALRNTIPFISEGGSGPALMEYSMYGKNGERGGAVWNMGLTTLGIMSKERPNERNDSLGILPDMPLRIGDFYYQGPDVTLFMKGGLGTMEEIIPALQVGVRCAYVGIKGSLDNYKDEYAEKLKNLIIAIDPNLLNTLNFFTNVAVGTSEYDKLQEYLQNIARENKDKKRTPTILAPHLYKKQIITPSFLNTIQLNKEDSTAVKLENIRTIFSGGVESTVVNPFDDIITIRGTDTVLIKSLQDLFEMMRNQGRIWGNQARNFKFIS